MAGAERRNGALVGLLDELGWSVSRLVREVNREVGHGYVSRSTASEWVNLSRVPRQPLPTVVAHVLSQARGGTMRIVDLWPGTSTAAGWFPADHGPQVPWSLQGTTALARDWSINGGSVFEFDRRSFMAVSGSALTAPAWQYADGVGVRSGAESTSAWTELGAGSRRVSPALVEYFRSTIDAFRRLDDQEGGSAENLRQVGNTITQVTGYLSKGQFTELGLARKLTATLAQLGQIGGWMAHDAERHGLSQRLYRTALHAAHSAGDRDAGSHILASMAYHAAETGRIREATSLVGAAEKVARRAHPQVRGVVASRSAHVWAKSGDVGKFHAAVEDMKEHFVAGMDIRAEAPDYLYWFDNVAIDTLSGQGYLLLSLTGGVGTRRLLDDAESLLANEVLHNAQLRPRYAVLHGAWLARAYARKGEFDRATGFARMAMSRMSTVLSQRTITVLRDLDRDLVTRRSVDAVNDVKELRRELGPLIAA